MSEFDIKVENVVAFTSLGKDISLTTLVSKIEDVEYEPEQFPGVVYRIQNPRAAALIFSSGKIVCTGASFWPHCWLSRSVHKRLPFQG